MGSIGSSAVWRMCAMRTGGGRFGEESGDVGRGGGKRGRNSVGVQRYTAAGFRLTGHGFAGRFADDLSMST